MSSGEQIRAADSTLFELFRYFRLSRLIVPANHQEQKEKFLEAWSRRKIYNPVFEYDPLPETFLKPLPYLHSLTLGDSLLEKTLLALRDELLLAMELVQARGTSAFPEKSAQLYGVPSTELVAEAEAILANGEETEDDSTELGVRVLGEKIREKLRDDRIEGWDVVVDPYGLCLAEADATSHKVRLREGVIVSTGMLNRLLHHIVEVHVYRAANAERQSLKVFSLGLDGYLETEEGLALELEERAGLLSPYLHRRYAARVLICHDLGHKSFFDIFRDLTKLFPAEEAYFLTERCKQGVRKTVEPGGFLRDHIYLQGKRRLAGLSSSDLRLLYMGKIGVHHLPLIKSMLAEHKLVDPAFIPTVFHD